MPEPTTPISESPLTHPPEPKAQPEVEALPPSPQRDRPFERTMQRAWRQLHYRFPRLVPSPYLDERIYLARRDAQDNLASRVPADERLRQTALWGVEIYGPGEVDTLFRALERLGWNDNRLVAFHSDPCAWIREQRTYGAEGNLNLGLIQGSGQQRFFPKGRSAPLPDAVDYAHGYVYQLSPSITAILLCFVLKESASCTYQVELGVDRESIHEPLKGGYRRYNVEHVKRRAIDLARTRSRSLMVEWFGTHLPGLFSRTRDGNRLPTAELITTTNESLFEETAARAGRGPEWVQLLSPRGLREIWTLEELSGLELCWPDSEGDLRYHALLNLRTSLLNEERLKHRGEHGDAAHASIVSDHVEGVLVNFAAIAALREIIRFLRLTPSSLSADTTSRRGTVRCLEQIRVFFDRSVGIPAFTSELFAKSEEARSYKWNCAAFRTKTRRSGEQPMEIAEALRSRTNFLSSRAQNLEKETREHLEQLSAILSTRENIRTQARMELVAVCAGVLSLASLAVAIISVDRFTSYVSQQTEKLFKSK